MLFKAYHKKIIMGESKLLSSNCKMVSRASSKLEAETASPSAELHRTGDTFQTIKPEKNRSLTLNDSEVCKFLQRVQVHGNRYTFAYRVLNKCLLAVRSILFQSKMTLLPYEVFQRANGRHSNFSGQLNFCRSKMSLPEPGPRKERQPHEFEKQNYKCVRKKLKALESNTPMKTFSYWIGKRGYCS